MLIGSTNLIPFFLFLFGVGGGWVGGGAFSNLRHTSVPQCTLLPTPQHRMHQVVSILLLAQGALVPSQPSLCSLLIRTHQLSIGETVIYACIPLHAHQDSILGSRALHYWHNDTPSQAAWCSTMD